MPVCEAPHGFFYVGMQTNPSSTRCRSHVDLQANERALRGPETVSLPDRFKLFIFRVALREVFDSMIASSHRLTYINQIYTDKEGFSVMIKIAIQGVATAF